MSRHKNKIPPAAIIREFNVAAQRLIARTETLLLRQARNSFAVHYARMTENEKKKVDAFIAFQSALIGNTPEQIYNNLLTRDPDEYLLEKVLGRSLDILTHHERTKERGSAVLLKRAENAYDVLLKNAPPKQKTRIKHLRQTARQLMQWSGDILSLWMLLEKSGPLTRHSPAAIALRSDKSLNILVTRIKRHAANA